MREGWKKEVSKIKQTRQSNTAHPRQSLIKHMYLVDFYTLQVVHYTNYLNYCALYAMTFISVAGPCTSSTSATISRKEGVNGRVGRG